jgi:flagellar basal body P-ring formation protein FlgA
MMLFLRPLGLVLPLLLGAAGQASAAAPRTFSAVIGPTVKLSDLFTDLEPGQDCDIGPAPAPGQRLVIGQPQLSAIADQFSVVLPPNVRLGSLTLERKGRRLRPEDVLPAVRGALVAAGLPDDADVELVSFVAPVVPVGPAAPPAVESLDFDPHVGRFAVILSVQAADADPIRFRLIGRARSLVDAVVLTRPEPVGAVLSRADVRQVRLPAAVAPRGEMPTSVDEVVGFALRRPLADNQPLFREMLERPNTITRGRPVVLRLVSDGLSLSASGQALEAGGSGDRIHVLNTGSRAILIGTIGADGEIRIDPTTTPVSGAGIPTRNGLPALPSLSGGRWNNSSQEAMNQ